MFAVPSTIMVENQRFPLDKGRIRMSCLSRRLVSLPPLMIENQGLRRLSEEISQSMVKHMLPKEHFMDH